MRAQRPASARAGNSAVVLADGTVLPADVVVVNADLPGAYAQLLSDVRPTRRRPAYSPSCVLVHLASPLDRLLAAYMRRPRFQSRGPSPRGGNGLDRRLPRITCRSSGRDEQT